MRKFLLLVLLLAGSSLHGFAQADCFVYEDEGNTIITDLTDAGQAATTLTIPKEVTTVRSGAFYYASQGNIPLSSLIIEDGGNPEFEANLFGGRAHMLTNIDTGNGMSEARIYALLTSLGSKEELENIFIKAYTESDNVDWTTDEIKAVLTNEVTVTMPAALVSTQQFGDAQVYGQFSIPDELTESTFCGNVIFEDTDDGSNLLFYVTTGFSDSQVKLKRVHYIIPRNGDNPRQGVLMHVYNPNGNRTVALKRVTTDEITDKNKYYYNDVKLFNSNMLIGTTAPTNITPTENDYTNLILYNGLFYRTSGGILGANKAYLQMPTENLKGVPANAKLSLSFGDDAPTEINTLDTYHPTPNTHHPIYNIAGQRVDPNYKGIVIVNGKKIIR